MIIVGCIAVATLFGIARFLDRIDDRLGEIRDGIGEIRDELREKNRRERNKL